MERNFVCTKDYPIADTVHGKIRGFELDGILTFHGIKYADAQRFQKPVPVQSWEGVKTAWSYGSIAPTFGNPIPAGSFSFLTVSGPPASIASI